MKIKVKWRVWSNTGGNYASYYSKKVDDNEREKDDLNEKYGTKGRSQAMQNAPRPKKSRGVE
ncbi:hypothetical protein [Paucidesulfovibrio gracilis]|uniref:hypothetical protein n=1 Tax=Paucidesulfovibrio gracilis TaxID=47158 RepID=UPI0011805ADF|nr:hypothetical protein [Paucidesulfovibrio gracilis]